MNCSVLKSLITSSVVMTLAGGFWLAAPQLASAQYSGVKPVPAEWEAGFNSITEDDSERLLKILTGEGFDGRGTGQEGYVRAASFVAGKLAEFGFQPVGDSGTYFQNLPYSEVAADPDASSIMLGNVTFSGADVIGFTNIQQSVRASGPVVIVRAAGTEAEYPKREEIEDKIVLFIGKDVRSGFERQLGRMGPAAVITFAEGAAANLATPMGPNRARQGNPLIVAELGGPQQEEAIQALGITAAEIAPRTEPGLDVHALEVTAQVDVKALDRPVIVPNVIGWLEGSDPEVNDEYIIIGAHLDHLGVNDRGLFPGADDNGSGSTAILQIAKALHENPIKPRRSVLYIAFAAEELGLIGSKHYVDNPVKPLDKAVCMLNIDMIGRNEEKPDEPASENEDSIHLVASQKLSDALHQATLQANEHVGFRFEYDEEQVVFARSDQYSFIRKGIPSTFLFGGFNPYYHQTTDNLDGINFSKIANCARLNYTLLMMASEHGPYPLNEVAEPEATSTN